MSGTTTPGEWSAEVLRRLHRIYGAFTGRLSEDPTIDTVLTVIQELAPGPVAVTDPEGWITHANFDFAVDDRIEPPALTVAIDVPARVGSFWCATPVSAPRSVFIWLLGHESEDPLVLMSLLDIAAERIHVLSTFSTAPIDQRRELVQRLVQLQLAGESDTDIDSLADKLDHDLERPHHVFAIEPPMEYTTNGYLRLVDDALGDHTLVALIGGFVVVILSDLEDLHRVVSQIDDLAVHGTLRAGASRSTPGGRNLRGAHAQALMAVRVARATNGVGLTWFEDCDLLHLLCRHAPDEIIDESISDILAPLLEYEGPHREEFTETLRYWLESSESLDALAERLHIHRSTLTYRVRRLRGLLGEDLRDPDRRFEMSLALRLRERRAGAHEVPTATSGSPVRIRSSGRPVGGGMGV